MLSSPCSCSRAHKTSAWRLSETGCRTGRNRTPTCCSRTSKAPHRPYRFRGDRRNHYVATGQGLSADASFPQVVDHSLRMIRRRIFIMRHARHLLVWVIRASLVTLALPLATSAAAPVGASDLIAAPEAAVGDWQYPEKQVWIHIAPNGMALQCRVAPGGTTYKSSGRFVSASKIRWDRIWGIDRVTLKAGTLSLSGKWGTFGYQRRVDPMDARCLAETEKKPRGTSDI